jgi:uncharacterized protein HemX
MKAIARTITVMAAALLIAAVPVFADEGVMGQQEQQNQKDECLIVARNCPTDSLQERIDRIQSEIVRGTGTYTEDELRSLERQLEEAQKFLEEGATQGGA